MNKELKALETIRKALEIAYPLMYEYENEMPEYIRIIESALKQQENDREIWENYLKEIKNLPPIEVQMKLKALEIIKEKEIDVACLLFDGLEVYNENMHPSRVITQEEYDLLKEVLE